MDAALAANAVDIDLLVALVVGERGINRLRLEYVSSRRVHMKVKALNAFRHRPEFLREGLGPDGLFAERIADRAED
jgi:hypothetical protein